MIEIERPKIEVSETSEDGRFSRFDYPALCAEVREMRRFVLRRLGLSEQVA